MSGHETHRAAPRVSVVVVHWNTPRMLAAALSSVRVGGVGTTCETIVVDNGSREDPARIAERFGARLVRNGWNRGYAAAANQGARLARGDYLLFLNSDATLRPGAIRAMIARMELDPSLAAVAPILIDRAGVRRSPALRFLGPFNHALALLGLRHRRFVRSAARPEGHGALWLLGAVLMVRRRAFWALGGFDEGFFFYEEDEDLGWRLTRRGYRTAVVAEAEAVHRGGASLPPATAWPIEQLYVGQRRFVRRRYGAIGELLYRLCVSAVLLGKAACRSRPVLSNGSLRALWRPAS